MLQALLDDKLEKELKSIGKIQRRIESDQATMVLRAQVKHSALCIQCAYRGFLARKVAKKLRKSKQIRRWLYQQFIAKIKYRLAVRLGTDICQTSYHNIFASTIKKYNAAVIIQKYYRTRFFRRLFKLKKAAGATSRQLITMIIPIAASRALRKFSKKFREYRACQCLLFYLKRKLRLKRCEMQKNRK